MLILLEVFELLQLRLIDYVSLYTLEGPVDCLDQGCMILSIRYSLGRGQLLLLGICTL